MTESRALTEEELATPLGQVFLRMLREPEFAGAVADDPRAALGGSGVSAEAHDALAHDGALIAAAASAAGDDSGEAEVAGFEWRPSPFVVLTNNENITDWELSSATLVNNENLTLMTPGLIRKPDAPSA